MGRAGSGVAAGGGGARAWAMGRREHNLRLLLLLLVVGAWVALAAFAPLQPPRPQHARATGRRLLQVETATATAAWEATTGRATVAWEAEAEAWASGSDSGTSSEEGDEDGEEEEAERNCTAPALHHFPGELVPARARRRGAALLHAFAAAYLFLFLALVCHDHFVPSIKLLCASLKLPEDVAGATFMAAATSSPELFVNCVGTFITEGDIGVGTVVGSGVFNILVVPACCGLFAGKVVKLGAWSVTRDCVAYAVAVVLLIGTLSDGRVEWWEAASFVVLYVAYVVALCLGERLTRCLRRVCLGPAAAAGDDGYADADALPAGARDSTDSERAPLLPGVSEDTEKARGWHYQFTSENCKLVIHDLEEEEEGGPCRPPAGGPFASSVWWLLLRPAKALLWVTVPDCRAPHRRSLFPLTFVMCVIWVAAASYFASWMITVVGDTLQIPDSVMGLTLLAAGTSLPEAASSVIVTNQGYGAMGISNSIGSNTFNILLCLGLPWLLKALCFPPSPGEYWVKINSGGLLYNTLSLLTTLFLLYISFAYSSFKLNRKVGIITLVMYIGFVIIAFAVELNAFGVVNLPTCPH